MAAILKLLIIENGVSWRKNSQQIILPLPPPIRTPKGYNPLFQSLHYLLSIPSPSLERKKFEKKNNKNINNIQPFYAPRRSTPRFHEHPLSQPPSLKFFLNNFIETISSNWSAVERKEKLANCDSRKYFATK